PAEHPSLIASKSSLPNLLLTSAEPPLASSPAFVAELAWRLHSHCCPQTLNTSFLLLSWWTARRASNQGRAVLRFKGCAGFFFSCGRLEVASPERHIRRDCTACVRL